MYKFQSKQVMDVCREVLLQCWVISSVKTDALDTNTINVILQQGYEKKPDESDADFNARLAKLKAQVLTEITNEAMRKAAVDKKVETGMVTGMAGLTGLNALTI
jgi:hypothetical protein